MDKWAIPTINGVVLAAVTFIEVEAVLGVVELFLKVVLLGVTVGFTVWNWRRKHLRDLRERGESYETD